ncbi:MAG: ABC transporter ATP-binding protein [Polyangiaceae bacterium]|nr:ABC transporter ATP-binding protein [Polyangiaceae bacterium]
MIEIRELYKYYGNFRALGPLDITIEKGEVVGLLGLNGSGKTTTLRILACDLMPTSGVVKVDGLDIVADPRAVRARVGYLPDNPPLYPEMTVAEYLAFAARLRGVATGDVKPAVEYALKHTRLRKRRDSVVGTLSHGFKQRLGIAQAIVHRPSVVVLDEPITGLDPVQIVEMRKLVRSLGGDHTVILSSHNLPEISETCDRILVITDGMVSASGTEAELSRSLLGQIRVEVTVRTPGADPNRLDGVLGDLPGVITVAATRPAEPGSDIVTRLVNATEDVRGRLVEALVGAGFEVLCLTRSRHELERVFLQLAEAGGEQLSEETDG